MLLDIHIREFLVSEEPGKKIITKKSDFVDYDVDFLVIACASEMHAAVTLVTEFDHEIVPSACFEHCHYINDTVKCFRYVNK